MSNEGVLKLGAHEPISISRPIQNHEMNLKHGHVEGHGDDDQSHSSRQKVLRPHDRSDSKVTEEKPKLTDCSETNRGDSEQSDPFTAERRREREAGKEQVLPPFPGERLALRIEVGETHPEVDGESGEEDEVRVKQDETGLSDEGVVEHDQKRAEYSGRE